MPDYLKIITSKRISMETIAKKKDLVGTQLIKRKTIMEILTYVRDKFIYGHHVLKVNGIVMFLI